MSAACAGVGLLRCSRGPAAPRQTGSGRLSSSFAASVATKSSTVSSTTSRAALPNTVERPTTSMPGVRASSAMARQSSGSVRAPRPQAASLSIHTRGAAGSAGGGVS